jgi:coenzyme PQQ synthesis protein D (PqqD)
VYYTTQVPMLVSRQFDDEIILANFDTGIYYSLIGTAADIWLGLKSGAGIEEIAAAFAKSGAAGHAVTAEDITNFVEKLLTEKIIAPRDDSPVRESWSLQFSDPASPPELDRFDDLRDLLFLDPVHDVSEGGWPLKAADVD